jgi:DNA-directed RNA polymerase specialized sigma24 family protein
MKGQFLAPFRAKDADLIHAARTGGKEAAVLLLRRHAPGFRSIARRVLAPNLRSILDPEDILQEIAVALLTRPFPDWIGTPADFKRYVGGIARNLARAHNRKHLDGRHHSRHREVPASSVLEKDAPSSTLPGPRDCAENKETLADLQDWLPWRIREIVAWVFVGYSVSEVASRFDLDEETVIAFVCAANNYRPHCDRKINKDDALRLFKRRSRPHRKNTLHYRHCNSP